jgi:hypothetical protein
MGRFQAIVPNINYSLSVDSIRLVKGVQMVSFEGRKLTAQISDDLIHEEYEMLARQLPILFAFSFKTVCSESYQIGTQGTGFHYTGQDERKAHLLQRNYTLTSKFLTSASKIYSDLLYAVVPKKDITRVFNVMHIWIRAYELQQLHLPAEASILLELIIDDMEREGPSFKSKKPISGLGIIQTESDQFAARIMLWFERQKLDSARQELEGLSYLHRMRLRREGLACPEVAFYLGKKPIADLVKKNAYLFEVTRLYVLWLFGLKEYYLQQQGNQYKIERYKAKNK